MEYVAPMNNDRGKNSLCIVMDLVYLKLIFKFH
jgi:hypothetical protein